MLKQAFSTLRSQREQNTRICFGVRVHSYHSHNYTQMISQEDHHYIGIYNMRSINYLIRNSLLLICDCRFKLITGVWRNFFFPHLASEGLKTHVKCFVLPLLLIMTDFLKNFPRMLVCCKHYCAVARVNLPYQNCPPKSLFWSDF